MEIVLTVTPEGDGGFFAECLPHDTFTQGEAREELRANVREAVTGYFSISLIRPPFACTWAR